MQNHLVSPRISGVFKHMAHGCAGGGGGVPAERALRAVAELGNGMGAEGLTDGQVVDLACDGLLVQPVCAQASPAPRARPQPGFTSR